MRRRDSDWLARWEATPAGARALAGPEVTRRAMRGQWRALHRSRRAGHVLPFVIEYDGTFAGMVLVTDIAYGAVGAARLGYWVAAPLAGRGIAPVAVALVADHCFRVLGLHRLEADVRVDNAASHRVMQKLGFVAEGVRRRSLHVDGAWHDHVAYALVREDAAGPPG